MGRTSVYLPDPLHRELRLAAARAGAKLNEILVLGARLALARLRGGSDPEAERRLDQIREKMKEGVIRGGR